MKKLLAIGVLITLLLQTLSVAWALRMERPDYDIDIKRIIENADTNGEASVGLGVLIDDFDHDSEYGADCITMNISMIANSRKGLNYTYETHNELYDWMREDWWDTHYRQEFANVGDDWGMWVDPQWQFCFKFYGGKYRNVYVENASSKIWVSSNGFVSFDLSNSTNPYSYSIPNPTSPNAIIAPLWADLKIDNQSKIIIMESIKPLLTSYLVVIWKNALHKFSGKRLTFAVALESCFDEDPGLEQGKIYIAYQNVTSISSYFTYGIENHEGRKGTGQCVYGSELEALNGTTLIFMQDCNNYFIQNLWLTFEDESWPNASYRINKADDLIRGYNVKTKTEPSPQPNENLVFGKTLIAGTNALAGLAGVAMGLSWMPFISMPVGFFLVIWGLSDFYTLHQYNRIEWKELKDSETNPGIQCAYIEVPANSSTAVDASLNIVLYWILGPPQDPSRNHNLTITAIAEYDEYLYGAANVTTLVNIEIGPDSNNSFDTADEIQEGTHGVDPMLWLGGYDSDDYYKIFLGNGFVINIIAYPSSIQDFTLYLYNPNGVQKDKSEHEGPVTESIEYTSDSTGWWRIRLKLVTGIGFYNMSISIDLPGSCPTLFVWNGSDYAYEALLNIHAESDITLQHMITQPLVKDGFLYKLSLRELDEFTSHIDQVRLYAVDSYGEQHICPLVSAIHSEQGWVTFRLRFDDDTRVDLTPTETIELKFTYWGDNIAYFIFEINGHNKKWPG